MARNIRIAAVQSAPHPIGMPLDAFESELIEVISHNPDVQFVVFPELHLFSADDAAEGDRTSRLNAAAISLDSDFVRSLGAIARRAGIWLLPGSICERGTGAELYNTALVFSPDGELVTHYRKVFPWRPSEPYDMGDRFVTFDIPGAGRFGISICYDSWFPEVTRQLAWMGAEIIINIVKTTTDDRAQELVLARANSIVNQTFTVSVNCAGPIGKGRSILVDPEGAALAETDDAPAVLVHTFDLDAVANVRVSGTAGLNRMWSQFTTTDPTLELPIYSGRISPERWNPKSASPTEEESRS